MRFPDKSSRSGLTRTNAAPSHAATLEIQWANQPPSMEMGAPVIETA
jgi:hypothetical protein